MRDGGYTQAAAGRPGACQPTKADKRSRRNRCRLAPCGPATCPVPRLPTPSRSQQRTRWFAEIDHGGRRRPREMIRKSAATCLAPSGLASPGKADLATQGKPLLRPHEHQTMLAGWDGKQQLAVTAARRLPPLAVETSSVVARVVRDRRTSWGSVRIRRSSRGAAIRRLASLAARTGGSSG